MWMDAWCPECSFGRQEDTELLNSTYKENSSEISENCYEEQYTRCVN